MEPLVVSENLQIYINTKIRTIGDFTIKTYSVKPTNKSGKVIKYGSDDNTYILFPELLEKVPRGYSELYVNKDGSIKPSLISEENQRFSETPLITLKGFKKFDGTSSIDEDNSSEDELEKSLINKSKLQEWEKSDELLVKFEEKANGKMFIFTFFTFQDQVYIFGGSKNVHIPHKISEPITGNELHHRILKLILESVVTKNYQKYLGKSIVGEYVDGQHMVYTENPYLVFFGEDFGIKEVLPPQNYLPTTTQLDEIRKMKNTEGVVINYINTKTKEVLRQKHKSIWYIMLRCWRELLSGALIRRDNLSENEVFTKLSAVINKRNNDFLHMDPELLEYYITLSKEFVIWLNNSNYLYSDLSFTGVGMAKVWYDFENGVKQAGETPNYSLTPETQAIFDFILNNHKVDIGGLKLCIIMQGIPGSGKSFCANKIKDRHPNFTSIFSTDDYFMKDGIYTYNKDLIGENHDKNYKAFCESKSLIKIVDNTNLTSKEYGKYIEFARSEGYINLFLSLKNCNKYNVHNVSRNTVLTMKARYTIPNPIYLGLFVDSFWVKSYFTKPIILIPQKTPLHITCLFKPETLSQFTSEIGKTVIVNVIGYSVNDAGSCLIVNFEGVSYFGAKFPHITLGTNKKYTAVKVGELISDDNIIKLEEKDQFTLQGVFLPSW